MTPDRHESPLEDQLRTLTPAPPADEVDWAALHARIATSAAPLLLRRRPATWWHVLAGRSAEVRRTAAGVAIAVLVAAGVLMPERPAPVALQSEFRTIEEELAASVPYASVPLLASGADDSDVLDALLLYDGEGW